MERVDHVHVIEIGCSCFVCDINRMLERQVPYRESLEFSVTSLDSSLVLMVKLTEAYRHLSASGTWSSDDHERPCGLYIVILSESFVRVDESDIVWISFNGIMIIHLDSKTLQTRSVGIGARLTVVMCHDDAAHIESDILEF